MEITYTKAGDYLIPDIHLSKQEEKRLILKEELFPHLQENDETAHRRLAEMMPQMAAQAGVTEELKRKAPMKWAGMRRNIQVHYTPFTAEWNISGKSSPSYNDVNAYMTFGTERANAYRILEDTLKLRDVRIYDTVTDPDERERRVLNSKETTLAQQKQQAIKDTFAEWIWKDPDRRQELVTRYNELLNSNRPREYDGRHISFSA